MNRKQFVKHYAVQRKNSVSLKWDLLEQRFGDQDLIPMWVADMDFRTPNALQMLCTAGLHMAHMDMRTFRKVTMRHALTGWKAVMDSGQRRKCSA